MRQGLDHIGFQVENVVAAGKTWQYRPRVSTISAEKTWRRQAGVLIQRDLQACPIGKHVFADPDGVLMDMTD